MLFVVTVFQTPKADLLFEQILCIPPEESELVCEQLRVLDKAQRTGGTMPLIEHKAILILNFLYLRGTDPCNRAAHSELLACSDQYRPVTRTLFATRETTEPLTPPASPKDKDKGKERKDHEDEGRYSWLKRASLSDPEIARALERHQEERKEQEQAGFARCQEVCV